MKRSMLKYGCVTFLLCGTVLGQAASPKAQPASQPGTTHPAPARQPAAPAAPRPAHAPQPAEAPKAGGVEPGGEAPSFSLQDTEGKTVSLADLAKGGKIVVVQWFNPGCPFVKKHYGETKTFNDLYEKYHAKGVEFVAICSSAPGEQGGTKEANAEAKKAWSIPYPILLDTDGRVGKAYGATNTPHMFVIGKDGKVAYAGAIDDNRGADKPGKTNYVSKALDEMLAGTSVTMSKTRPYGCPVKYSK